MADLSQITMPSGTTYNFKDAEARSLISELQSYTDYLGVTTTVLTDGATTNPIKIGSENVTAKKGNIVNYNSKEFIFNGTGWQEFGDLSGLGALAYKNSATGSYTPAGTVSQPTFTGSASTVTITATDNTSGNYQPKGTVSKPTFTGSSTTFTGKFTPEGTVSVSTKGTTNKTATVSPASSGTATYTPAGTVSQPTISVKTAGSTTTIKNPTSVTVAKTVVTAAPGATAPANSVTLVSVSGENLIIHQLGYTTGDSITTSNVTVKNGDAVYESSTPTFTGTGARLVTGNIPVPTSASFTGTEGDVSVSGTPTGTVSQPTFTGTGARLVTGNIAVPSTYTATFTGTEGDVSASGTPNGSVSQPTFTGTKAQFSGTTTAEGSVSQPTFTGTAKSVTVS